MLKGTFLHLIMFENYFHPEQILTWAYIYNCKLGQNLGM